MTIRAMMTREPNDSKKAIVIQAWIARSQPATKTYIFNLKLSWPEILNNYLFHVNKSLLNDRTFCHCNTTTL